MSEIGEGLPFSVKPGEILSRQSMENVTRELGLDFVVKTPTENSVKKGRNSIGYLIQTKEDYELLQEYVGCFVPETYFVRANNEEGRPTNYILQRRLKGKIIPLHELGDSALQDESVRGQLLDFIKGVMEMDKDTGKIPDMFGRPLNPFDPRFYDPRFADNICIVENDFGKKRVVLTDVGAITEQKEKKGWLYKVAMIKIRTNLRKFEEWLSE